MRNIKLTIEYNGTNFHGWQTQGKGERTIQNEIKTILEKILKEEILLIGSGRTDSGVHALGQVANFKTQSTMPALKIAKVLNSHLPEDIAIRNAKLVDENFHAQYSAHSKTYRYIVLNHDNRCVHQKDFCYRVPKKLNLNSIRTEAKSLIGKKDFKSFVAADSAANKKHKQKNTIRTIKRFAIKKNKEFVYFEIEADGFLYKMVRNIIGTLLKVGSESIPKGGVKKILNTKNRKIAGPTAPAKGLCLLKVKY